MLYNPCLDGITPQNVCVKTDDNGWTELIIFPPGTCKETAYQVFMDDGYYIPKSERMNGHSGEPYTASRIAYVYPEMTVIIHKVNYDQKRRRA